MGDSGTVGISVEVDELVTEQKQRDAGREAMADEIIAGQRITSLGEGLRFARAWIVTAAQHAANEDYYRDDRDKLLVALRDAVRQGGELRRRAIMAGAIDEHEDPFESLRQLVDEYKMLGPEPPISLGGAFSEDFYNKDGSEVTIEQVRERSRE